MKISVINLLASSLVSLSLSGCYLGPDSPSNNNYREKGKPALMEDIVGIWADTGTTDKISYVVIRADGTYRRAHYEYPDDGIGSDYSDCYTFWDTSITYLEDGKFLRDTSEVEIYLYEGNLGIYYSESLKSPSLELDSTELVESESTFLPVCE